MCFIIEVEQISLRQKLNLMRCAKLLLLQSSMKAHQINAVRVKGAYQRHEDHWILLRIAERARACHLLPNGQQLDQA